MAWHPGGEILVSCSYDDSMKLWREADDEWACEQTLAGAHSLPHARLELQAQLAQRPDTALMLQTDRLGGAALDKAPGCRGHLLCVHALKPLAVGC